MTKRVLLSTVAKAFGTFASPTTNEIIYVDPKHEDERHHSPKLDAAEARFAFERGLIEDPEGAAEADQDAQRDPNALSTVATEKTAEFSDETARDDVHQSENGLDSRSSTNWSDRERVEGGVDGSASGLPDQTVAETIDEDSGDEDAPPADAPRRGRRKAE